MATMHAEGKIFFGMSVLFALVDHYGHLYRVKEAQSKNKRTLCSHPSCTMASICAERKIFFSLGLFVVTGGID